MNKKLFRRVRELAVLGRAARASKARFEETQTLLARRRRDLDRLRRLQAAQSDAGGQPPAPPPAAPAPPAQTAGRLAHAPHPGRTVRIGFTNMDRSGVIGTFSLFGQIDCCSYRGDRAIVSYAGPQAAQEAVVRMNGKEVWGQIFTVQAMATPMDGSAASDAEDELEAQRGPGQSSGGDPAGHSILCLAAAGDIDGISEWYLALPDGRLRGRPRDLLQQALGLAEAGGHVAAGKVMRSLLATGGDDSSSNDDVLEASEGDGSAGDSADELEAVSGSPGDEGAAGKGSSASDAADGVEEDGPGTGGGAGQSAALRPGGADEPHHAF